MKEQAADTPPGAPHRSGRRLVDALAGVVAGALTLAAADLVAQVLDPASSPLLAVGGTVIDLTPGWLKDFAVSRFGTSDKLVLLLSMGLVVTALAAAAGLMVRRRPRVAALLVLALGLVAAAAAAARPGGGPLALVPSLAGVAAGLPALLRYGRTARPRGAASSGVHPEPGDAAPGRRQVLLTVAGTAGAAALVGAAGRAVPVLTGHGQGPADVRLPAPSDADVLDAAAASVAVDGVTPFVTSARDFYRIDTALVVPKLEAARLAAEAARDGGSGGRPRAAMSCCQAAHRADDHAHLRVQPGRRQVAGNARWLGYPLERPARGAGVQPDADMVVSPHRRLHRSDAARRSDDGRDACSPSA